MNVIEGDILDVSGGVICHQVNCYRTAGAGLALQIRNRFPGWYEEFVETAPRLGQASFYQAADSIWIASLYAQQGFGRCKRFTNYAALGCCLMAVRRKFGGAGGPNVFVPYGMGCGLGGGDWGIVQLIVEDALPQATLVKWKELG